MYTHEQLKVTFVNTLWSVDIYSIP